MSGERDRRKLSPSAVDAPRVPGSPATLVNTAADRGRRMSR